MMAFAVLKRVHEVPGRVRWRYRLADRAHLDALVIERAIENLPGVIDARVNPAVCALVVHFDMETTDAAALHEALLGLDLGAPPRMAANGSATGSELATLAASGALLLSTNVLPAPLRLPAGLGTALPLFDEALADLRESGITSHVLEALAVAISLGRRDYTAANVTTFMLALGEYLEHSIARRSDDLLKHLLRPDTGLVWIEENGVERQVEVGTLEIGATVIVGAGATIPIDGTVLGGEALVNEAAMTGESAPVRKTRSAAALSGTVVEEGRLRIYAENVGRNTAAARIADYVERSLIAKSQAQLRASTLADRLVPAVLGLAGGAWLLSGAWQRAAAVLQADFSCALKLATPVAFKSAMYRAGKNGILVKGADVLERLAQIDTVVFDKTGTLTTGRLAVTDSIAFDKSYTPHDLLALAASVEEHYFHPLALAVVEAARLDRSRHFDHKEVHFIAAHGVASVIAGKRIVIGSRHFVEEDEDVSIGPHRARIERLYREGKTVLYIGYGGRLLGVLALKDAVRAESRATIARLRALGVKQVLMLTGAHRRHAEQLAQQLGLDGCHAELLPDQKAEIVEQLSRAGTRIAFVGDGINDAPALAGAHVGIAMQRGADIARLTSDVALLEDDIGRVADAKELADATMRLVGSNFRLALSANSGILGAAAFGRLSPVLSSVLHNGSTIGILLRALLGGARRAAR